MWSRPSSADYNTPHMCSGFEIDFGAAGNGHSLPDIQNLQPHSFCGQLGAFVIRAFDVARLKNLCVLVYKAVTTKPMRSRRKQKCEYKLQVCRHVGRFVVHVGAQTAMVLLDTPILVGEDEVLAFTCLASPAELSGGRNSSVSLESPGIVTTGPDGKLERTPMHAHDLMAQALLADLIVCRKQKVVTLPGFVSYLFFDFHGGCCGPVFWQDIFLLDTRMTLPSIRVRPQNPSSLATTSCCSVNQGGECSKSISQACCIDTPLVAVVVVDCLRSSTICLFLFFFF